MNKTKRALSLAAAIIVLVYALGHFIGMSIFADAAAHYWYYYYGDSATGFAVMFAIFGLLSTLGGVFLLVSVKDPDKFAARKNLYWAGVIITILMGGLITFPSILLYVSLGFSDNEPAKPIANTNSAATGTSVNVGNIPVYQSQHEVVQQPVQQNRTDMEIKIDIIRDMKAKGEITEEEYKSLMFRLLK